MAYNPRSSIIPSSQQRSRKKEEDADTDIRLKPDELVQCIHDLGFNLSRADLEKPNPAQVQPIFELFADELLNTTREMVQPAMREVAEDMCGEFADVIPTDTRDLVGFYGQLQQLMLACGIKDFSFSDLYKLTPDRLAKIFSHAINLVRFRESQMAVMDEHLGQTESVKKRIEMLRDEVDKLGMQVEQERRNQQATEARTEEKKHRNNKLTELLSTTLSATGNLRSQVDELKDFKSQLVKRLREQSSTLARLRQESERMQSCLRESPSTLHDSVADLRDSLSRESGQADAVEKNHRALQTWVDVIDLVAVHVDESVKALHDIVPDVTREEEKAELSKATADELSKARKKERQLEQDMAMRRRQVDTWGERIKELQEESKNHRDDTIKKMVELQKQHKELMEEHTDNSKDVDRRRVRVDQMEKKILDYHDAIFKDIQETRDEYVKLESHVNQYMNLMEQLLA